MERLKTRSAATLVLILVIIGSTLIKSRITFTSYQNQAESLFYEGINGESIAHDLESKAAAAKNLLFIAQKYTSAEDDELLALTQSIDALESAATIDEKEAANRQLNDDFMAFADWMTTLPLDDRDEDYRHSLVYDYQALMDTIRRDPYHAQTAAYIEATKGFPAAWLYTLSGAEITTFEEEQK